MLCSTLLLAPWQHPGGWSGCGKTVTQAQEEKGEERRERKERKAREKVKYLLLLSNTSAEFCPVGWWDAFRAFQLTEVIVDEGSSCSHLKTVTIHSTLLVTAGHHWLACVSANMSLCCYNTVKGTAEFPLSACQSFFKALFEAETQADSYGRMHEGAFSAMNAIHVTRALLCTAFAPKKKTAE